MMNKSRSKKNDLEQKKSEDQVLAAQSQKSASQITKKRENQPPTSQTANLVKVQLFL